jgi:hypothetical protein
MFLSTFCIPLQSDEWLATNDTGTNFLKEFQHPSMVSIQVHQYDPVELDLYQSQLKLTVFKTQKQKILRNTKPKHQDILRFQLRRDM